MTLFEMETEIRKLIREYAPYGTRFNWDRATKRFGCCKYRIDRRTGKYFDFVITISRPLASRNTWEEVRKVALHEIAHARTAGHGHDAIWRRECIAIGGDGRRCYRDENHGGVVVAVPTKYMGVCPKCGMTFPRNRRCNGYHCDKNQLIVWKVNRQVA